MASYKSFYQLYGLLFDQFMEMDVDEKKRFLNERGISFGGKYIGTYDAKKDRVIIDNIKNPFTRGPVEGILINRRKYEDGSLIRVRLVTGRSDKEDPSPDNVFWLEYIGLVKNGNSNTPGKRNEKINKSNKSIDNKDAALQEKVDELTINIKKLVKVSKDLKEKNDLLEGKVKRLEKTLKTEAKMHRNLKLEKDYSELSQKYTSVWERNNHLQNEIDHLKKRNSSLQNDIQLLIKDLNIEKNRNAKVKESLEQEKELKGYYYQQFLDQKSLNDNLTESLKYRELIDDLRNTYGFEGFVHYTAYENLKSIMDSGYIMSRNEMLSNNIDWMDVADEAVLQDTPTSIKGKVRLSYGFNTPISYRFEETARSNNTEMVALVVDPMIFKDCKLHFFEKSAARSHYGVPAASIEELKQFNWDEIFERGPHAQEEYYKKRYRDAEVVVDGKISIEYVTKIYFRSRTYLNRAINEIGPDNRYRLGIISDDKHFSSGINQSGGYR